jgi:hypothetical protein
MGIAPGEVVGMRLGDLVKSVVGQPKAFQNSELTAALSAGMRRSSLYGVCFQPRGKSFGCRIILASCEAEAGDADAGARPEEDEALVLG